MTDPTPLPLSRDDILNAFVREAEAATEQIVRVSEKLTRLREAEGALRSAFADYIDAHREAVSNPTVSAKLTELAIPAPGSLSVTIGAAARTSTRKPARKARPASGKPNAPATASAGEASGGHGTSRSESGTAVEVDGPQ